MWFVRTYLKANLKISFKLKTFFLLQTPLLRIYSIEVKLPIHRDVIGAKIVDIRSGKNFVTKWVRAKPVGTGILWKAERCARTPQIVTCHMSQKSDSCHLPGKWEEEGFFFFPLTDSLLLLLQQPCPDPNHWVFCSHLLWASLRKWPLTAGKVLSLSLCSFPQRSDACFSVHHPWARQFPVACPAGNTVFTEKLLEQSLDLSWNSSAYSSLSLWVTAWS